MEEINKKGFTKKNLKKLFSFSKGDAWGVMFIILLLISAWGYIEDTKACRNTLSDPYYQKCALYTNAARTAEALREKYPNVQVNCDPEIGRCEISGVVGMPGMPTREDIDALNISAIIYNISE